eukprot:GHVT01022172.1.p1 GENE.GHVT01022172.1~~GHVT01022172.1.p1  ORF type:complete len:158 (-),score=29.30 GHVT01022172.1:617-1090(-)
MRVARAASSSPVVTDMQIYRLAEAESQEARRVKPLSLRNIEKIRGVDVDLLFGGFRATEPHPLARRNHSKTGQANQLDANKLQTFVDLVGALGRTKEAVQAIVVGGQWGGGEETNNKVKQFEKSLINFYAFISSLQLPCSFGFILRFSSEQHSIRLY